jgi:hypothetical protein
MIGFGQGWETSLSINASFEIGHSIQQTTDGGYIISGMTKSAPNGEYDSFLLKTDGNGIEQWSKIFGSSGNDYGLFVEQTIDGGYVIAGRRRLAPGSNVPVAYILKTNSLGDSLWSKTFGDSIHMQRAYCAQQTIDGGYIITGQILYDGYSLNPDAVMLIKTDGNGLEQWSETFANNNTSSFASSYGLSVKQTDDGGYIICGRTNDGYGPNDSYLIKTYANGTEQWSQTFGGVLDDNAFEVQQTDDGGYIISGYTESFGNGNYDVYLIKTDGNGTEQWSQTFGGTGWDGGTSVQQTTDGGYIITGFTESFGNSNYYDVYLIKTDGNGTEQWSQTFGGSDANIGYSVKQTDDGGYIITGMTGTDSPTDLSEIYLIKTDSNGNVTSTFNIPTPNPNRKLQKTVDILGKQTKPQTNTPFIEIYDDGTVEKRIVIE